MIVLKFRAFDFFVLGFLTLFFCLFTALFIEKLFGSVFASIAMVAIIASGFFLVFFLEKKNIKTEMLDKDDWDNKKGEQDWADD